MIDRYNRFITNIFKKTGINAVYDVKNKEQNTQTHILYMLSRTQSMFKWHGLPETIPQRMLELYIQIAGCCAAYKHEGKLYVFTGGLGGEPDEYYQPTIFTIANPYLNLSKNLKIGEDCIVIRNDALYIGLIPLFSRYASQMAENELSINRAMINTRIIDLISASDDKTRKSAEKYLKDVEAGETGVIAANEFFEGVKAQPYAAGATHQIITDLIELEQYLKASWYNEIGLNANYNMKRESLNSEESQLNNDALLPLIDDMLKQRQEAAEQINKMFGTNITVELASSWEDNAEEIELEHKELGAEPEETEPETAPEETGSETEPEENEPEENEPEETEPEENDDEDADNDDEDNEPEDKDEDKEDEDEDDEDEKEGK